MPQTGSVRTMSSTTGSSVIDSGIPPATVAGPGDATKSARPRRTWTSSARIDSATSSAVSAPMSIPAGARSAAIRSSPTVVSSRSHSRTTDERVGDATSPTYAASLVKASPTASSSQMPWLATTTYGAASGSRPRMSADRWTRAPGNASSSAMGSMTVTFQPAAAPTEASAPAIGVVPTTQSCEVGRCGST